MALEQLLAARADLWRGHAVATPLAEGVPTGFAALDQVLPWHGWPDELSEVLSDQPGAGMTLLLPMLRSLCQATNAARADLKADVSQWSRRRVERSSGWLLLVNPPLLPYAPALTAHGVDLKRIIVVDAPGEGAWVMEQGLRAGACAAVLCWADAGHAQGRRPLRWSAPVLRRLQLAAAANGTPALLLRPSLFATQSSPAPLRLTVAATPTGLCVTLVKLRGGRAGIRLDLETSASRGSVAPASLESECCRAVKTG